jgi:hypothetical protein
MTTYNIESRHETWYGWRVDAPAGLEESAVGLIVLCMINYSDTPSQQTLMEVLNNKLYLDYFPELDDKKLALLKQVKIETEVTHRDYSAEYLTHVKRKE